MGRLTTATRNRLPTSVFAGPGRSFPIEDKAHGRAALSRAHFAKNPGAIRAAVHRRFPTIGKKTKGSMAAHLTKMRVAGAFNPKKLAL